MVLCPIVIVSKIQKCCKQIIANKLLFTNYMHFTCVFYINCCKQIVGNKLLITKCINFHPSAFSFTPNNGFHIRVGNWYRDMYNLKLLFVDFSPCYCTNILLALPLFSNFIICHFRILSLFAFFSFSFSF